MYGSVTTSSPPSVRAARVTDGAGDFDRLIVAVAQSRDREAFARLFEHFAPRLKSWLIRGGAADGAAEEFAQEAMLIVWRKADLFDPRLARASTWIFTIARNRRLDALRRDARAPLLDLAPPPIDPDRPDDLLEERQDAVRIRQALAVLTPEQAQVVHLSFFLDQPHSAIADRLSLPLGTVKSRIRKAMLKLRLTLEQEGGR
ncbi:sigma-70 family RNA polymerase sigma factor [Brevundimonas sp. GCM10030266]|jgi:RNA polymerase sigma-70 factor (ECF subfamily)|uniref:sigma-70 family RNA polymerase sigma factor n=1 Tax=Brevundimonas sp. GCM10030266 TaxID=3273386 RepID=UPI0036238F32